MCDFEEICYFIKFFFLFENKFKLKNRILNFFLSKIQINIKNSLVWKQKKG